MKDKTLLLNAYFIFFFCLPQKGWKTTKLEPCDLWTTLKFELLVETTTEQSRGLKKSLDGLNTLKKRENKTPTS